ncbi:MAG: hypothetical protein LBC56_07020 [Oscillospiraceae bacterium]|jgi:hypothetical protein|nr:hypothetical protein [Oscillospiraceae bacterium]
MEERVWIRGGNQDEFVEKIGIKQVIFSINRYIALPYPAEKGENSFFTPFQQGREGEKCRKIAKT